MTINQRRPYEVGLGSGLKMGNRQFFVLWGCLYRLVRVRVRVRVRFRGSGLELVYCEITPITVYIHIGLGLEFVECFDVLWKRSNVLPAGRVLY